jgi:hypothetical protein
MPVSDWGVAMDLTGAWVILRRTVGTTYSLGGVSTYFKEVDMSYKVGKITFSISFATIV